MNKQRKTGWFLLLLILLITFVTFVTAQETPTADDGLLFHQDLSEPLPGAPLTQSSGETPIELSSSSSYALPPAAASISLAPGAGLDVSQEPPAADDGSDYALPDELRSSPLSISSSLAEPEAAAEVGSHFDFSGFQLGAPQPLPSPDQIGENCQQLLVNTQLNLGGVFPPPPWVVLEEKVYYSDVDSVSDPYSLVMVDNDVDDQYISPTIDAFGQAITVPSNLTSVKIEYFTASMYSNTYDDTFGALWLADGGGYPTQKLFEWGIGPSEGVWQGRYVDIFDPAVLQQMQGKYLDVIFLTDTSGSTPGEVVWFDDIKFTACYQDTQDPAYIKVRKETTPDGAAQDFRFQASWLGDGSESYDFLLKDGQSRTSPILSPGNYSVAELAQSGWDLDSATCSDGSNPANISLQAGETVTCTFRNVKEVAATCSQILVNTKLNIVEFGDGYGSAEPWVILDPIVWYTDDPATVYGGVGYSLLLKDGDHVAPYYDPSPTQDTLAQGFQVPRNLVEFRISYQRKTANSNPEDKIYGNLWLLDEDWILDTSNAANFVLGWEVGESEGTWTKQSGAWVDPSMLKDMTGRKMAILLFNSTDGGGTAERVYFDNVLFTACAQASSSETENFLPSVLKNYGEMPGPVCTPPTENPADRWYSDRGLVQTGAVCNSTLNTFDQADHYSFTPNATGSHTLSLTKLPEGTKWTAFMFVLNDPNNPYYAPGDGVDGTCFPLQIDDDDKIVRCSLIKGTDYYVKVSAGETPVSGSYELKITAP